MGFTHRRSTYYYVKRSYFSDKNRLTFAAAAIHWFRTSNRFWIRRFLVGNYKKKESRRAQTTPRFMSIKLRATDSCKTFSPMIIHNITLNTLLYRAFERRRFPMECPTDSIWNSNSSLPLGGKRPGVQTIVWKNYTHKTLETQTRVR